MKHVLNIDMIGHSVVCIDSIDDAPDFMQKEWNDANPAPNAITFPYNGDVYILFDRKDNKIGGGVLCHEVYHAVSFLCNIIGYRLDSNNDEMCAYLAGYIYTNLCEFVFYPENYTNKKKQRSK